MANTPLLKEIFLQQFSMMGDVIPSFLFLWQIIWTWGWIFIPFLLWPFIKSQWLFWRNVMWAVNKNPHTLLEVKIPEEIEKPIRAMEVVLSGMWQLYGPPNWFEKWWEGQFNYSFSLEITSIDGVPHFLLRVPLKQKTLFEQHIYSQYPDAEIFEVEDYTQKVPQNIPNDRWEIWGTDYTMVTSDCYPLKTYRNFETENERTEERKIEPISSLIEGLSMLEEGEQIWIQIKAKPVTDLESGFQKKAKKEYDKLAGRKEKPPPLPLFYQITNTLFGFPKEEKKEDTALNYFTAEMMLTPIERETVESIERKRVKHIFECFIRYVYIARKEKLNMSRIKIPMSYFNQFSNPGLGQMIPYGKTITKVKRNWYDFFWRLERRLYLKKRRMFKNYVRRENSAFPLEDENDNFILSSEELATLYHFPSKASSPPSAVPRVEAKKKEAPYNLPTDD